MLPADVQYKADIENGGVARAYNYALGIAQEQGFDWLLTLDQDTSLPIDFLCKLYDAMANVAPLNNVAAIVPRVSDGGQVISPFIPTKHWWIHVKHCPNGFIGVSLENVFAVNSASTIRVNALKAIGGYDPRFQLYASDLVMYHSLHRNNFNIFVAGNIHVEHEISGSDLRSRSTPNSYEDMLRAEEAFFDEYLGRLAHIGVLLMMFYRLAYGLWTAGVNFLYFRLTLRFLCRRLFYQRKHRIESWKQSAKRRLAV
jgi:GT2 family glycosyltransferase